VRRSTVPLVFAAVVVVSNVFWLGLGALPNLWYRFIDGGHFVVGDRGFVATEYYGLKLINLVLPLGSHRIEFLQKAHAATAGSPIPGEGSETLGVIGSLGLVLLGVALIAPVTSNVLLRRLRPLAVVTVAAILFGMVDGIDAFVTLLGFAELRAGNRISIFIAFLCLAAVGWAVQVGVRRFASAKRRAWALTASATVLLAVCVFDQTSDSFIPDYAGSKQAWIADSQYFSSIEDQLGSNTAVFELPVDPFPEQPPIVNMGDYELGRGYLHTDLRWSYGGVKGGISDWQNSVMSSGVKAGLPKIVAMGFDAIYVDRRGYADSGAAVEQAIQEATGATPMVSADGFLATYDIRSYAHRLRGSGSLPSIDEVLHPLAITLGEGAYVIEGTAGSSWQWAQGTVSAALSNPTGMTVQVVMRGTISVADASATETVSVDGQTTTLRAKKGVVTLHLPLTLPPGQTMVTFTSDSAATVASNDPRTLVQRFTGLTVVPQ